VQIIYLLPFVLLSLASGLVCLVVPRWRRYVAGAVISPIAFAGCSIVALFTTVLLVERFGGADLFDQSLDKASWGRVIILAGLYVGPGAIGAIGAALVANRVQRWIQHRLGF
jgi:hypothetical protein